MQGNVNDETIERSLQKYAEIKKFADWHQTVNFTQKFRICWRHAIRHICCSTEEAKHHYRLEKINFEYDK